MKFPACKTSAKEIYPSKYSEFVANYAANPQFYTKISQIMLFVNIYWIDVVRK